MDAETTIPLITSQSKIYSTNDAYIESKNYSRSSLFGKLFFSWVYKYLVDCQTIDCGSFYGSKIRPEDLPKLTDADSTFTCASNAESQCEKIAHEVPQKIQSFSLKADAKISASVGSEQIGLISLLFGIFKWSFLLILLMKLASDSVHYANTYLLKYFIVSLQSRSLNFVFGGVATVVQLVGMFFASQAHFYADRIYIRLESTVFFLVFRKILLKNSVLKPKIPHIPCIREDFSSTSDSKAINLMFVDVPALVDLLMAVLDLFILPLRMAIIMIILYSQVGWYCIPGAIVLFGALLIMVVCEISSGLLKAPYLKARDLRLSKCHEILFHYKAVAVLGWQGIAEEHVMKYRSQELKRLRQRAYLSTISSWLCSSMSVLTAVPIFIFPIFFPSLNYIYSSLSDPCIAIPVIHLLSTLLGPVTELPFLFSGLIEGYVSLVRLQNFIFPSSISKDNKEKCIFQTTTQISGSAEPLFHDLERNRSPSRGTVGSENFNEKYPDDTVVRINDCTVGWFSGANEFNKVLSSVNIELKRNDLCILIGNPAAGKSTLIQAVVGTAPHIPSGSFFVRPLMERKPIGLVSQQPWIPNGSVGDIITFWKYSTVSLDAKKQFLYNRIVEACHLSNDFSSWNEGDGRIIDEGGRGLSAGQRVRITIARALFVCAEHNSYDKSTNYSISNSISDSLFCFDDIFNNIDPRIGCSIFENLFRKKTGLLIDSTVILVIDESNLVFFLSYLLNKNNNETQGSDKSTGLFHSSFDFLDSILGMNTQIHFLNDKKFSWTGGLKSFISDLHPEILENLEESSTTEILSKTKRTKSCSSFENQTNAHPEFSCSGPVFSHVYLWYFKYTNLKAVLAIMVFLVVLAVSDRAKDISLEKWTVNAHVRTAEENTGGGGISSKRVVLNRNPMEASHPGHSMVLGHEEDIMFPQRTPTSFLKNNHKSTNTNDKIDPVSLKHGHNIVDSIHMSGNFYLWIFFGTGLLAFTLNVFVRFLTTNRRLSSATTIHQVLLSSVLHAPMWFVDNNSLGRLLTRFVVDQSVVDAGPLHRITTCFTACCYAFMGIVVMCSLGVYILPLVFFTIYLIYSLVYVYYRPATRELHRCKLLSFSPVFSLISEVISGRDHIRALNGTDYYDRKNIETFDVCQSARFHSSGVQCWTALRLQLFSFPLVLLTMWLPMLFPVRVFGPSSFIDIGFVGLALSYSLELAHLFSHLIFQISFVEKEMCSVERIQECINSSRQEHLEANQIHSQWTLISRTPTESFIEKMATPSFPKVDFVNSDLVVDCEDVEIRYKKTEDYRLLVSTHSPTYGLKSMRTFTDEEFVSSPCITNFNFQIRNSETVGIVGRSGTGKTTLLLAFIGLIKPHKGKIMFCSTNIKDFTLEEIHERVGILMPSSTVLSGWTVRKLVDPKDEYADSAIWTAAKKCGVNGLIRELENGLETILVNDFLEDEINVVEKSSSRDEDGTKVKYNRILSDYQIRFFSLVRLVLNAQKYRLLLIDEPAPEETIRSDVYSYTEIINREFMHCAKIIVSHHAKSLRYCNRILVLEKGRVVRVCGAAEITTQKELSSLLVECHQE